MAITLENRKRKTENGKKPEAGFALLIAIIFMSVMLSFGLALGSLGYKQQVLASSATASQYAFYAADAGLECALYADQRLNAFSYILHNAGNPPAVTICNGMAAMRISYVYNASHLMVIERFSLNSGASYPRCADVTIYKYRAPQPPNNVTTYLFSVGYDVSCDVVDISNARFVSRGIQAHY